MVPVPARPELELPFAAFVRRVADDVTFALTHGEVPLGEIVHGLGLSARLRGELPFNVGFSFHDSLPLEADFPGLACRVEEALANGVAKFDLDVVVIDGNPARVDGVEMLWEYDAGLFDAATVARLAAGYEALVDAALAEPGLALGRLPVTTGDERRLVLGFAEPSSIDRAAGAADVPTLVAAQAALDEHAPALTWAGETLARGALRACVRALASRLAQAGAGDGRAVAVLLPRGFHTVIAPLAVMEAGGTYLPLDAQAPAARLRELMADSGAGILLTHGTLGSVRPEGPFVVVEVDAAAPAAVDHRAIAAPAPPAPADRIAYAIYTSGSTGRPKAVRVGARALAVHVRACLDEYGLDARDRVLLYSDASVDASLEQMLVPLAAGACVVIAVPGEGSLHELARFIDAHAVTVADLPTAVWHAFVREDEAALHALPLRLLLVGGEPVLRALRPARALPYRVLNAYGPTEAAITACVGELGRPGDSVAGAHESIGRPLAGGRAYLLDEALAPVPRGLAGELCLAGPRLASDYLGRPELTQAAFVADPFGPPGGRLYRTGDLGRWLPDGRIEFLGRVDGQLKVRGFRVEAGEVESVLAACAGVREAAVYAQDDGLGGRRLVAAVAPLPGAALETSVLARTLRERLPHPMVPSAWRVLEQLPRTPGGKLDRRALGTARTSPEPAGARHEVAGRTDDDGGPADTTLREVLAIVGGLLPEARPAAHDDLVDLGLHSVLILRFLAQCRQRLAANLKVRDVYRLATPSAIAGHIVASR
jgi:amino acid adenylation domain-containing protein